MKIVGKTITRERLQEIAEDGFLKHGESKELARMALAAMDSEPVKRVNADQMHHVCLEANRHLDKYGAMAKEVNKLLGRIPAHPAPVVPEGLRMALSNAGIAAPESDEMLAATHEKYVQALVMWVRDRKPFQPAPVVINDDMAYAFHHALTDSTLGADDVEEIKDGLRAAFASVAAPQPAKSLELAGWQFKSVNGDWLGLIDEHGKNQAVREGCEVREVFAMADGLNERDQVRREHAEWSQATFGNVGPIGPLKHLSKEALEAAAEPGDLSEWADMQFLLWDAQRRAGITDEQITQAMIEKLVVNKQREWPEPKDGEPRLHIKEQPAPVVPDGYVMVPMRLTAENGAKGALSGEFSETKFVNCPECFGDDECETCDGSGRIEITVPVTWTTIKEIWAKGVEHFAAAPKEVKGE